MLAIYLLFLFFTFSASLYLPNTTYPGSLRVVTVQIYESNHEVLLSILHSAQLSYFSCTQGFCHNNIISTFLSNNSLCW